jgi:nitroimidazol reductase NimA-like FMN-containing flavoprotein (pyridoxamine 5'-phosphate oxidase superfamily)
MTPSPRTDLGPFSGDEAKARPWAHTVDAIRRLQKFTLCTVRADGRPHATPLLAVWAMDGMAFATGKDEQKAKNLTRNPKCILTAGTNTLTGDDHGSRLSVLAGWTARRRR